MTWGFSGGVVDLDDWVYPFYHTDGTRNSFKISDPVLDPMLEAQRREFDTERRRELGLDIQRYLLGVTNPEAPAANVRIDYVSPYVAFVRWPYFRNAVTFPWFGSQYWLAEAWLDRDDPSYAGRAT
jgi:hypothetical protein